MSTVLNAINKKFGNGKCVIARASDCLEVLKIRKWETGTLALDLLLDGGLPKSSIVEYWGPESSLKTTMALINGIKFTKQKEKIALIDLEGSFDPDWAILLGLDLKYLDICKPATLDVACDILEALTLSGDYKLIILDSVASGITSAEQAKPAGKCTMAKTAQIMTPTMGKLISALQPEDLTDVTTINETTIILINQMRNKIVMMGSPEESKGGFAKKHACSAIIKFRPNKWITREEQPIGRIFIMTSHKSKISVPHKTVTFNFYFDKAKVDNTETLIIYGIQLGVIKQSGPHYTYGKLEKIKGKVKLIEELKKDKKILKKLKSDLFNASKEMKKEIEEDMVEDTNDKA